ncbi:retrovirus-related pol polyprotein from transposon TNT 1-94 [Tanacetum coccineum]
MLCYLARMEPYYLKCIKDGPFQPKTAEGDAKPESHWTPDKRRVVVQDQRLKRIIMSCLSDDVIESVISCVSVKETWTDLVYSFEGPLDTKENRIMDLKLEYQTFWAKYIYEGVRSMRTKPDIPNKDFQENSDDEVDERTSEEYLRDLDIEYHEISLLANSKHFIKRRKNFSGQKANENTDCYKCGNKGHFARDCFSKTSEPSYKFTMTNYSSVSKGFQPKFTPKLIQSSSNSNNQVGLKFQKDYKAEYKKMKAKLALLEVSPLSSQNPKTFQPKNKGLVTETFDWDEEEVSDEVEVTQVKLTSSKKVSQCISEQIPYQKKKVLSGELLTESSSKKNEYENLFVLASMGYDHEMVPKTKDWVERLNPDSKHPNFNTRRILVPESQAVNESLETSNTPESSKDSEAEFLTPLPPMKILQGASPSSKVMPLTFQPHSPKERPGVGIMKHTKPETQDSSNESISGTVTVSESKQTTSSVPTEVKDTEQESKLNELTKLIQMLIDEKVNSDQKTQESNSKIQKDESSKFRVHLK